MLGSRARIHQGPPRDGRQDAEPPQEAPGGSRGTPGVNTVPRAMLIWKSPTTRCPRTSVRGFLSNVRQARRAGSAPETGGFQAGAPFDCRARCPARASGRRPAKRLTLDGHSPVMATRCHVSREASIVPAVRELPGPAACRWCWRRATSCRWWSAAEARRASAAWTVEPGWSRSACPAETGCSTAGPGC